MNRGEEREAGVVAQLGGGRKQVVQEKKVKGTNTAKVQPCSEGDSEREKRVLMLLLLLF